MFSTDYKVSERLVADVERVLAVQGKKLTYWENDFIHGLTTYFRRRGFLSELQKAQARKIIKKYTKANKKPNQGTFASEPDPASVKEA